LLDSLLQETPKVTVFRHTRSDTGQRMGKRPRSEDDDENCGQGLLKTHVSEKEVNMGVLKEKNMQNVYNKTMAMLFRGTKNLANNNAGIERGKVVDVKASRDKVAYKQLSLTPLGAVSSLQASCCSCVTLSSYTR